MTNKNRYGFNDGDCIDNSELLNRVLGRKIGWIHFGKLEKYWKEFFDNCEKYEGTVVVDMVNLWADDELNKLESYDGPTSYGSQYVMLDDSDGWDDDSNISCSDCPDDECTGHCFSCAYRSF